MERAPGAPAVPSASRVSDAPPQSAEAPGAANLRMVALASAVALAVIMPLAAATAGPAGPRHPQRDPGGVREGGHRPAEQPARQRGAARDAPADVRPDAGRGPLAALGVPAPGAQLHDSARCGPELTSPEGVEAQTCVLEEGRDTWARTYFRNATGGPLTAVLTLMGPDGRTVQVRCRTGVSDDPDECETPRSASARGPEPYEAVTEVASEEGKLLLRSGSNSPEEQKG
ncbi:hypothetical protein ACFP1Z_06585 [Streptomyces gamaensis]|uniref:Serine/threonine protein kinase n=1 Tax=Streptomyces gamaensis TaxID=1763542 RepID=A0ABW0YZM5_9ACTN